MGLFNFGKKDEERPPRNMNTLILVRLLAVGYLCYCYWQIVQAYLEGGEEAPQWWLLLVGFVVLVGGSVWIAIMTFKEWKREQERKREAQDEEDALLEAEKARAEEEDEAPDEEPEEAPDEEEE